MNDQEFLAEMLKKYPRYVKIGKHTGQVRMYGPAWSALREFVWHREKGKCFNCPAPVLLETGSWLSMQAAHRRSKGAGGSDLPSNVRGLCALCHTQEHAGKKIA